MIVTIIAMVKDRKQVAGGTNFWIDWLYRDETRGETYLMENELGQMKMGDLAERKMRRTKRSES